MLSISLLLGFLAFWEMAPQFILEVDPTAILNPPKLKFLKEAVIHKSCEAHNSGFVCMCTDLSIHTNAANGFEERALAATEETRTNGRTAALAMTVTSIMIGIILNAVATSHLTI